MGAVATLPKQYRGIPSIQKLGERMDALQKRNRDLKSNTGSGLSLMETSAAMAVGAALCGGMLARGYSEGAVGATGGALAVAGILTGQPTMVHAANGILAPLIAQWAGNLTIQASQAQPAQQKAAA